jgi:hypothetical protein
MIVRLILPPSDEDFIRTRRRTTRKTRKKATRGLRIRPDGAAPVIMSGIITLTFTA